nr:Os03g0570775 [Ipomoea batatas]
MPFRRMETVKRGARSETALAMVSPPVKAKLRRRRRSMTAIPITTATMKELSVSKHSITAEASDSLKKSQSPENASQLNPLQVLLHFSLHKIYPNCAPTMIHQDRLRTRAPPRSPQSHTYKTSHVRKMCRIRVAPEMPKTKRADAEATVLDSPSKRRICLEKRYVAMRGRPVNMRRMVDLWR